MLDVDFEWFDPDETIDFHGLKTLLRQLFDVDNQLFDLSELSDLILKQPLLGSTVKCDGKESDPYAFLSVVNLHQHREKTAIKQITEYILKKSQGSNLEEPLKKILDPSSPSQLGLILSERFINMPHQIVPPLYNFITEELQGAIANNNAYPFTHYLVISKTYTEVAAFEADPTRPAKKKKASASNNADAETFYFHVEDEVLQKYAVGVARYDYEKADAEPEASDAKRTFSEMGIKPQGSLILLEGKKFEGVVKAIGEFLNGE